ncbi:MAG: DUF4252 domain-containing protein [Bacteroidales bacterium]|nr:DUF4252 domain-containing protein [Bacteroidales bacterium]
MKKLLIILMVALPSVTCAAKTSCTHGTGCNTESIHISGIDSLFRSYEGKNGYQSIVYGRKMLDIMAKNSPSDIKKVLNGISLIRMVSTRNVPGGIYDEATEIASAKYELISIVQEDRTSSQFFILEGKDAASFLMITQNPDGEAILEIYGSFDIKDISRLSILGAQGKMASATE